MILRPLFVVSMMLAITAVASSQSDEAFALRLQGGGVFSVYSADFTTTGDIIDCGEMTSGTGFGPSAQLVLEFPLSQNFGLGFGIGFAGRGGSLTRSNTAPIRDTVTGNDGVLTTEVALRPQLDFLELQPDLRIALVGDYRQRTLGLVIGPRLALPLTSSYTHTETIISPESAVFTINGERRQERTIDEGPFTTRSSMLVGGSVGLESLLPVSDRITLVPSVAADVFVTNILTDATWTTFGIRAEMGVRFSFHSKPAPVAPEPEPPVVVPPPPPPAVIVDRRPPSVEVHGSSFTGEVVTGNQLRATVPIVNAVFFDSSSADVPTSYRTSADGAVIDLDAEQAHSAVLPRIASIVTRNPKATVVLEGATSGATSEPEGITLAARRAENVARILVNLGVDRNRIETTSSVLPRVPSNQDYAEGRAENRRVDIVVRNAPLQEWVSVERFAKLRGVITVLPVVTGSTDGISNMKIRVGSKDTTVNSTTDRAQVRVEESLDPQATSTRLRLVGEIAGSYNERDTTIDITGLPRRQIDLATEDFDAVLRFDYNSAVLSDDVKLLLRQLVERIPSGKTIVISGSADILGTDQRNKELSEQRARTTEQYLRSVARDKSFTYVVDTTTDRFGDVSPQGRFLNRSIRLRVK